MLIREFTEQRVKFPQMKSSNSSSIAKALLSKENVPHTRVIARTALFQCFLCFKMSLGMLPKEEDEANQRSYTVDLTALWIELHCGSDCTVDRATLWI